MNKLEVIAWSVQDVIDICNSKAHRIELVADIEKGGLTPSIELVREAVEISTLPIRVMVREKDESFIYDDGIMDEHISFINELKNINPEGIVFGSLTNDGKINVEQLERVIKAKGEMKLTFHRAFDELCDECYLDEYRLLSKYDVDTLLTSGTKENALIGIDNIRTLIQEGAKVNILPGKSISIENARKIVDATNAKFIHVGYSVRDTNDQHGRISIEKINEIVEEIN